ncbi:MAG: penicillin binding protein PBP4B, partial [Sarcina sp.]
EPEHVDVSKERLKIVDNFIEEEIKGINAITGEDMIKKGIVTSEFPSAILTVVKDNSLIKNTVYGYKNLWNKYEKLKNPDKTTLDTMYDIASNTKMYATNYALMKLVYEGRLNLDHKVEKYLKNYRDEFNAPIKGKEFITIRNLLKHDAGHPASIEFYNKKVAGNMYAMNKEDTINALGKIPLIYEVGTKVVYSDLDYMILGHIVEVITKMPLDKYVEEHIYKPLGLERTCFNPLEKGFKKDEIAATERNGNTRDGFVKFDGIRTYTLQGEVQDEKAFYCMGGVSGHAGLFSTGEELAILCQVLLNGGSYGDFILCDKDTITEFIKPDYLDPSWGLGWNIQDGKRSRAWMFSPYTYNTIGHTGWTGTLTSIDFENNMIVVLLTNKRNSPCVKDKFESDKYETGNYGSVVTLVYEAFLENRELVHKKDKECVGEVVNGMASQIEVMFPDEKPSSRYFVRNRRGFYGYEGIGEIIIENKGVKSCEVYINGHRVDISSALKNNNLKEVIDVGKYIVNGVNSLKVLNIKPDNGKIEISINYPQLMKNSPQNVKNISTDVDRKISEYIKNGGKDRALSIIKKGVLLKESYYGNIDENTLISLGNGTEVFSTVLAINKLISEGKLNYNDLANKYIPEIDKEITIKNLLEHTSGLPEYIDTNLINKDENEITLEHRDNSLKTLANTKPEFIPGSRFRYSVYDSYLLGMIIEKVTSTPQDKYVEENIYAPLGLKHTMYNPIKKGVSEEEILSDNKEKHKYTQNNLGGVSGAYGLYTTTKDLAILCQTIINYGGYGGVQLFSKDITSHFISPTDKNKNYGHGLLMLNENGEKSQSNKLDRKIGIVSDTGVKVSIDMFNHEVILIKN